MLIYLQPLDIDICENVRQRRGDDHRPTPSSSRHVAAECVFGDDDDARVCDQRQEHDEVAVDAVEDHQLVPDRWDELEAD